MQRPAFGTQRLITIFEPGKQHKGKNVLSGEFVPRTPLGKFIVFPSNLQCNQGNAALGIASQSTFPEAVRVFVSDGYLHPCVYWRTNSISIVVQVNIYP